MNNNWSPVAIMPNLSAKHAVEGDVIALAPRHDPRVLAFSGSHPKFELLISRFTDEFGVPLNPVVQIVRDDAIPKLAKVEPLASFRDLVALCVVPYARSLVTNDGNARQVYYSDSFWVYPWNLSTDDKYLVASTPAAQSLQRVDMFHGQSSPAFPLNMLTDVDKPLFEALLPRWKRHFLGNRSRWQDRALFRSLNMAAHASQLPAGIDTTFYDLGRTAALWVSAFEILAHPRIGDSGFKSVYALLEKVTYLRPEVRRHAYSAYMGRVSKMVRPRRPLPCWLYGMLYQARCDFLHGNPVGAKALKPNGLKVSLFWLAPFLYRLALVDFLGLSFKRPIPKGANPDNLGEYISLLLQFERFQRKVEEALLRARG